MTIQLGRYTGEKNKILKNIQLTLTLTGTLRDASSVVNPSVLVEENVNNVCGYNYAYIPEFKRYYYIQNCEAFRTGLTVITLSVDVLYTYKESILNSPSIISRSSKTGDGIFSLPDDRYPVKQSDTTRVIQFNSLYSSNEPGKGETMILVLTGIDNPAQP